MGRRLLRPALAAVALAGVLPLAAALAAGPATTTYRNPVYEGDFPDPFVLADTGGYYAYATNADGTNVQVLASTDLATWVLRREALPGLPAWASPGTTWAPSVLRRGATYVLYYTVRHRATGLQCVSHAVAVRPDGPFVDRSAGPIVCQTRRGGSIDPSPVVDGGRAWLLWKSEGVPGREPTRIWSRRLDGPGTRLVGPTHELLRADQTWEQPIVEGPTMARAGGTLWLLYSAGRWETDGYAIGHAACATPAGPCHKRPGPLVRSNPAAAGPGGQELFRDADGTLWLAYHAWAPGQVGYPHGRRSLRVDKLAMVGGRLVVQGPTAGPVARHGSPDQPAIGLSPTPTGQGYRLLAADGDVFALGDAVHAGSPTAPAAASSSTPSGAGYWVVARDGRIHPYGDAVDVGSPAWTRLAAPITAMAPTTTGAGYRLAAADGGVFTFGDATFHGSAAGRSRAPVVGIAPTPTGRGYWLAAADGGVFAFGDATFHGSAAGERLRRPVVSIAAHPARPGYWLAAADGGVFAFGAARFHGSAPMG